MSCNSRRLLRRPWGSTASSSSRSFRCWLAGPMPTSGSRCRPGCSWAPRTSPSRARRWPAPTPTTSRSTGSTASATSCPTRSPSTWCSTLASSSDVTTKLVLEYDGTDFAGWARQPERRTVQEELEVAIRTILQEHIPVTVAGRTDAGVHAWGQVASYDEEALDPRRLNGVLSPDVAVLESTPVHPGFDARRDATSRTYCYRLPNRRERSARLRQTVWWVGRPLDRAALDACAAAIVGTHDFTAFTPTETEHVRFERHVFSAQWREPEPGLLEFWIT